jgi:hypothetical protein
MKTEELVSLLANGAAPVEPNALRNRYTAALGWGAFGTTLLMALLLGVRPDLVEALRLPMFWVKMAFPAALLAGAVLAVVRLSRPGAVLGRVPVLVAAPVLAMWLLAAVLLLAASPGERNELILGHSAASCPFTIALLSVPLFAAALWAMRGLAPTRLALSGAAAGLLAGSGGALVYALYCPEMAAPFIGIWYLLGMLIPTALGAMLGPRALHW